MNVEVYSMEIIMACDNGQVHTFIVTGTAVLHVQYMYMYMYMYICICAYVTTIYTHVHTY